MFASNCGRGGGQGQSGNREGGKEETQRARAAASGVGGKKPERLEERRKSKKQGRDGRRKLCRAASTTDGKDAPRADTLNQPHLPRTLRSFPSFGG